jgi:hypothetical protein
VLQAKAAKASEELRKIEREQAKERSSLRRSAARQLLQEQLEQAEFAIAKAKDQEVQRQEVSAERLLQKADSSKKTAQEVMNMHAEDVQLNADPSQNTSASRRKDPRPSQKAVLKSARPSNTTPRTRKRSVQVCWDYEEGNCSRGKRCRFSHSLPETGARASDWVPEATTSEQEAVNTPRRATLQNHDVRREKSCQSAPWRASRP